MALLSIVHGDIGYGAKPVLSDISLNFRPGEIVSLLGPNGSGKTTLLKGMLGFLPLVRGSVTLDGQLLTKIPPRLVARRIAYVPQLHRLSFAYRVIDVVLMGRLPYKSFFFSYTAADRRLAMQALEKLSIAHLCERPYTDISGGERQLTLVARALTQGAEIFIMDEPVNGLDYGNQIRLLERIGQLADAGFTFIKTTHFPDHALWVSDRVIMLRQGRVVADGKAFDVIDPDRIFQLYDARVNVLELPGGGRICVPQYAHRTRCCRHTSNLNLFPTSRVA